MVEKILWKERKCFRSFLPIVFIGILTLWIYGIGIIFIAYAISKWFRTTYTITEERILQTIEHYAFHRKENREINYDDVQDIKISQTFFQKMLRYWRIEIIGKSKNIVLETANKEMANFFIKRKELYQFCE
ncbi:MAG: PH domain-containing protein [Thermoplasmata archaeon]|nr:PH domain-containing protein [Thermoplasmata archaeon]